MTMPPENNPAGPAPDEHIPIPDEHYAAIGKMADSWADLEFEIDQLRRGNYYALRRHSERASPRNSSPVHPKLVALVSLASSGNVAMQPSRN